MFITDSPVQPVTSCTPPVTAPLAHMSFGLVALCTAVPALIVPIGAVAAGAAIAEYNKRSRK